MAVREDSNPRYVAVYTLSRRAPSASRTSHRIVVKHGIHAQRGRYYREKSDKRQQLNAFFP